MIYTYKMDPKMCLQGYLEVSIENVIHLQIYFATILNVEDPFIGVITWHRFTAL